jgi:chorismate mutase/prephenate dehydratase
MSASIALQKDVSIAYLGPPGTFSHQAAYNRLGDSVAYVPQKQIDGKKHLNSDTKRTVILILFA